MGEIANSTQGAESCTTAQAIIPHTSKRMTETDQDKFWMIRQHAI